MDAEIVHANGMGSPCSTRRFWAAAFAGHGVLSLVSTRVSLQHASLVGLQLTLAYDPSVNSEKATRSHHPRFEAKSYNLATYSRCSGKPCGSG
jgi:hypothetical protein